jgi:PAS domain S-box-containing protein
MVKDAPLARYGIAAAGLAAALLLRWALDPWLGDTYPLAALFGAVAIAVWFGGTGPAIAIALSGYGLANYLFIEPRGSLGWNGGRDAVAFLVYLFTCALLIGFGEGIRRARLKADAATKYLNRALVGAHMVAWEWEPDNKRFTVSDNARNFFGLSEPLRQPEDGLAYIHPADTAIHADAVRRSLKAGNVYHCAYRVIRPADGRVMWVEEQGTVTRNVQGRAVRFAGITVDITAQKELEQLLVQRAEELHEADRRKNDFLALLAHELRNPLAPMRTSLQIMKMVDTDGVTAGQRAVMERQVSSIGRMIDDLMDVSRIDRGKIKLHRELVNLNALIGHAVETAQPAIDDKRHRLTLELPCEPLYVDADETRIRQAVGNLLINACKFTHEGGHITIHAARDAEDAVLRVRDDGIGIAPDQQEKIFERFVQLDSSLERVAGGLGIGLTLVKTLVELHGGSVASSSAGLGKGSEFTIRLPLAPPPQAALQRRPAAAIEAPASTPRRIVVVDDNTDAAESLALILRLRGHEVRSADRGQTALEIGAEFQPQVIVLDLGMPELNGYDTARRIRDEAWGKHVLLIALTGWGQPEDMQRSAETGFDHHLTKPADLERLGRLIDGVPAAAL